MKLRRPSPALLIACLALFISLGGVSYGVATGFIDSRELKNNTVRTQDLRNNDIRGKDIRNSTIGGRDIAFNTLTGSDINESRLANVPATTLGGVGLNGLVRTDATDFADLALTSSWVAATVGTKPQFNVDSLGYVHLRGVTERAIGVNDTIATLPAGARPPAGSYFVVARADDENEFRRVEIQLDGDIVVEPGAVTASDLLSLDGITFRAG